MKQNFENIENNFQLECLWKKIIWCFEANFCRYWLFK